MELAPAGINGKKLFNYRPMLVAALGLMAGIACCMHLNTVGAAVTALILAVLAGVFFFWLRKRRIALFVLAVVFGLMLGLVNFITGKDKADSEEEHEEENGEEAA